MSRKHTVGVGDVVQGRDKRLRLAGAGATVFFVPVKMTSRIVDEPTRNPPKYKTYDIECADGVVINIPTGAARHFEKVFQDNGPNKEYAIIRDGNGIMTSYRAQVMPDAIGSRALTYREAERLQQDVIEPARGVVVKNSPSCKCDIKELMSTGHVAGCPEKR